MRHYDITPFFRSTIGFDRLFDFYEAGGAEAVWPPYDIEKVGDDHWRIVMAVAGIRPDELEVTQHDTQLLVTASRAGEGERREYLHRGIAEHGFRHMFNLANHVRVEQAEVENGMLVIDLHRERPEALKPRLIPIGSASRPRNDNATGAPTAPAKVA